MLKITEAEGFIPVYFPGDDQPILAQIAINGEGGVTLDTEDNTNRYPHWAQEARIHAGLRLRDMLLDGAEVEVHFIRKPAIQASID